MFKKSFCSLAIVLFMFAISSNVSYATDYCNPFNKYYKKIVNKSKTLDRSQFSAYKAESTRLGGNPIPCSFDEVDLNSDGKLSKSEIKKAIKALKKNGTCRLKK